MTTEPNKNEVSLFLDTNAFIQLRDVRDLPWLDLFGSAKLVRLMVSRPVIQELDNFKTSTNARRRKRARLALKLIEKASLQSNRTLVLKEGKAKIMLQIPPHAKVDWDKLDILDQNSPDDRLVAAAHVQGNQSIVFSHDSGPRISARDVRLTAIAPPEDWLLPAEQTDDQRKIGSLERKLKLVQDTKPSLSITFPQAKNDGCVVFYRPVLPLFDPDAASRLTKLYLEQHPIEDIRAIPNQFEGHNLQVRGNPVSNKDARQYRNDYQQFENDVAAYLCELHECIHVVGLTPDLNFQIKNTGGGSAEKLSIEMSLEGGMSILASKDDIGSPVGTTSLPTPPKVAERRLPLPRHMPPPIVPANKRRNPTSMNWYNHPKVSGHSGSYGCQNFHPKRIHTDIIGLLPNAALPVSGKFTVSVSANDLAEISDSVDIRIEEKNMNWKDEAAFRLLPEFIREHL